MINNDTQMESPAIYTSMRRLLGTRHWAKDLKLFSRQAARSMLLGETRSRFRGRGMEFEEVRLYQAGDDIRSIDWRVTARTGDTHTKLYCEEHERPVHLIVDQRSSLFFGSQYQFKSVLAAEIATAIAWAALAGSDRIGGQIIGDSSEHDIRGKRSKQTLLKFIHDLNEMNLALPSGPSLQTDKKTIANAIEECRRITRPGTAIFIISDFHDFDDDASRALSTLGRHCDVTLLQVVDPLETNLPLSSNVAISNGRDTSSLSINKEVKRIYADKLANHQAALNKAAIGARAHFAEFDTSKSARQHLSKIFAKAT